MASTLTISTDCSGIEAPIVALESFGIPFRHIWSSESDTHCRKMIETNFSPETLYTDIFDPKRHLPHVDIYVVGFPCMAYSSINTTRYKTFDTDPRAKIIIGVRQTLRRVKPKIFVLENVKGFMTMNDGREFKKLQSFFKKNMKEYDIYHALLNTKDYGIPQNRERLYIVGISKTLERRDHFVFPPHVASSMSSVSSIIDRSSVPSTSMTEYHAKKMREHHRTYDTSYVFLNLDLLSFRGQNLAPSSTLVSCLTAAACSQLWNARKRRYATTKELLRLQGFDPKRLKIVVSRTQICRQIGNSMSVNVLTAIFRSIFEYIKPWTS